ncbi:MAG: hypothetical protein EOO41_03475, partial [Methanobacteriota archaeon]
MMAGQAGGNGGSAASSSEVMAGGGARRNVPPSHTDVAAIPKLPTTLWWFPDPLLPTALTSELCTRNAVERASAAGEGDVSRGSAVDGQPWGGSSHACAAPSREPDTMPGAQPPSPQRGTQVSLRTPAVDMLDAPNVEGGSCAPPSPCSSDLRSPICLDAAAFRQRDDSTTAAACQNSIDVASPVVSVAHSEATLSPVAMQAAGDVSPVALSTHAVETTAAEEDGEFIVVQNKRRKATPLHASVRASSSAVHASYHATAATTSRRGARGTCHPVAPSAHAASKFAHEGCSSSGASSSSTCRATPTARPVPVHAAAAGDEGVADKNRGLHSSAARGSAGVGALPTAKPACLGTTARAAPAADTASALRVAGGMASTLSAPADVQVTSTLPVAPALSPHREHKLNPTAVAWQPRERAVADAVPTPAADAVAATVAATTPVPWTEEVARETCDSDASAMKGHEPATAQVGDTEVTCHTRSASAALGSGAWTPATTFASPEPATVEWMLLAAT